MRRAVVFAWALAVAMRAVALTGAPAGAVDNPSTNSTQLARQRFREAREAYRERRYSAAASLFEAADRLAPHPSTRFNAATAWEQAGEAARAATGYEAALAVATLDDDKRKVAEERLSSLRIELGKILVQRPLGAFVTVDHVQRAPVPTTFYLLPGSYQLQVDYQGETSVSPLEVLAGREHDVELDAADPQPISPPLPAAPPEATQPLPPPPAVDAANPQRTWGWVTVGAGVALGGAAIALGLSALAAKKRFEQSDNTDPEARSEAVSLRLATNVMWGGATAAGVTGLVLVLTAPTVEF